ncbi:MAG: glutamate--cysteine ligase [Candidatus Thiodiazotropha sp. (ex Ctena orbiculata)]|nr:glutamate--cysteine ligase [Candidatus Thiodiazotropha taylori]
MGQEITSSNFTEADIAEFQRRLIVETRLLESWFKEGVFDSHGDLCGLELEACILNQAGEPAPLNQQLLAGLDDQFVVPELATFNVEINTTPRRLQADALDRMFEELQGIWRECNGQAESLSARMGMVGILPSLRQADLSLENMSPLNRYRALNDQVFKLRRGQPVELHIDGRETLDLCHDDVMLESAATSFQIHLQVAANQAAKLYNLSKIVSAPMVALSANSPYLFGRSLWDETRIPLFEQSISVGASDLTKRVSFGIRYLYQSMMENFSANLQRYPVLLPRLMDEPVERLAHLRLHNGTIWRWNRPLIGFNEQQQPHLRIEHRVVPAGPTLPDMIANAAFYFGLVTGLAEQYQQPEREMGFIRARSNFYQAARFGLQSQLYWFGWQSIPADRLIAEQLLPIAKRGLRSLNIDPLSVEHWLGIVEARVKRGINGAGWQKQWVANYGLDMQGLTLAYLERQESGKPVHEWSV